MKVVSIIGSPRSRGNTYKVVEQVIKQLAEMDNSIDFEYLFLTDFTIKQCTGCFCCIAKGESYCPLNDDIVKIKSKMASADGIILAAPCYSMGVPGIMKNFIDRLSYTLHRPCFFDQAFLAVTTIGGVVGMKQALEQVALLSAGGRLAKKLAVISPPVSMPSITKKTEKKIRVAAKAFYGKLQKPKRKVPGFLDWMHFHSFKGFTDFKSYQKACPADYAYYKDKKEFLYPLSGHPVRRFIGKAVKMLMKMGLRMFVEN